MNTNHQERLERWKRNDHGNSAADDVRGQLVCRLALLADGKTCFLSDRRIPSPDVFGHLADHQILRNQLSEIAEELRIGWPEVQEMECGLYDGDRFYIAIRIQSYTTENVKSHALLVEQLKLRYPQIKNFAFHCLPVRDPDAVSIAVPVYTRAA